MDPIALKWNNHDSCLINSLDHFKAVDSFVDVTLVCEGHTVKAHKVILAAGSNVLRRLLLANPAKHPILILAETKYDTLRIIIDFLYKGRVDIPRNDLHKVLQVAATFEINDLKNICEESLNNKKSDNEPNSYSSLKSPVLNGSSVRKKRQRRQSSDSDILIEGIVPKRELNFSPCCFEQPQQTELVEFCPQISDTRSVISSVEPSTRTNLTGSFIQKVHKDAFTECDILSATTQAEVHELHPQVSDSRNVLLTSVDSSSESDLANSSIQQGQNDASTECDNFSATAQTEIVESHPPISSSRMLLPTSVESSTRSDLTASSVQRIQKNASTECTAQPLKELMCNNGSKPTGSLPNPKQKVITVQKIFPVGEFQRKKRTSKIWNFFTAIDETYALCTICKNKFSYRTTVTNLRKHMKNKHWGVKTKRPLQPSADNQILEEMDIIEDETGSQVYDPQYAEALDEDVPSTSTPCILKITS